MNDNVAVDSFRNIFFIHDDVKWQDAEWKVKKNPYTKTYIFFLWENINQMKWYFLKIYYENVWITRHCNENGKYSIENSNEFRDLILILYRI